MKVKRIAKSTVVAQAGKTCVQHPVFMSSAQPHASTS